MLIFIEKVAKSTSINWDLYITALIALAGVIATAVVTLNIAKKSRLVDTVLKERLIWIKDLRRDFAELNSLIEMRDGDEVNRMRNLLFSISLSLKPSEKIPRIFLNAVRKTISDIELGNEVGYEKRLKFFIQLEHVILKSEWERVKREANKGKLMESRQVEGIYDEKWEEIMKETIQKADIKEMEENIKKYDD